MFEANARYHLGIRRQRIQDYTTHVFDGTAPKESEQVYDKAFINDTRFLT